MVSLGHSFSHLLTPGAAVLVSFSVFIRWASRIQDRCRKRSLSSMAQAEALGSTVTGLYWVTCLPQPGAEGLGHRVGVGQARIKCPSPELVKSPPKQSTGLRILERRLPWRVGSVSPRGRNGHLVSESQQLSFSPVGCPPWARWAPGQKCGAPLVD